MEKPDSWAAAVLAAARHLEANGVEPIHAMLSMEKGAPQDVGTRPEPRGGCGRPARSRDEQRQAALDLVTYRQLVHILKSLNAKIPKDARESSKLEELIRALPHAPFDAGVLAEILSAHWTRKRGAQPLGERAAAWLSGENNALAWINRLEKAGGNEARRARAGAAPGRMKKIRAQVKAVADHLKHRQYHPTEKRIRSRHSGK